MALPLEDRFLSLFLSLKSLKNKEHLPGKYQNVFLLQIRKGYCFGLCQHLLIEIL
jgi:hypothetical protein